MSDRDPEDGEGEPLAAEINGAQEEKASPSVLRVQVLPASSTASGFWRLGHAGDLTEPLTLHAGGEHAHTHGSTSSPYGEATAAYCCQWQAFSAWVAGYLGAVLAVGLLGAFATPTTAIVALAFLPNLALLAYLVKTYRQCVLVKQGVATFFEAALIMCPLVIAENLWNFIFFSLTRLPQQVEPSDRRYDSPLYVLSALVMAYTVAGFF